MSRNAGDSKGIILELLPSIEMPECGSGWDRLSVTESVNVASTCSYSFVMPLRRQTCRWGSPVFWNPSNLRVRGKLIVVNEGLFLM